MKTYFIFTASWVGMVILAILNGGIREKTYGQFMGDLKAHQLFALTGLILFRQSGVTNQNSQKGEI